jgi:2,3-bisphosphoglycerate-dependent phosphoglycerate mutase
MTRVVLIRHGESACNVAGVVGGHKGCSGLSDEGRRQAQALRDRLAATRELASADALYSSVLERAVETARIISPAVADGTLAPISRCGLCELHPGEGDGLAWAEFEELYGEPNWFTDPSRPIAPGGESWAVFTERVAGELRSVAEAHSGGLVVVACHGGVVEASMQSFLPFGDVFPRPRLRLPTAYTSLTEWEIDESGWRLVRYNDVAHLGGPHVAQMNGPHTFSRRAGDQQA